MRAFAAVAIAYVMAAAPAAARDDGRFATQDPKLHAWFDRLASKKGLCCSFADGVTIDDPDVDTGTVADAGGAIPRVVYRVRVCKGLAPGASRKDWETCAVKDWVTVPPEALVTEPNKFGRAVVWPYVDAAGVTQIRCFIPGAGT